MSQFKEELKSAMNQHMDLMSDLVEKFSGELRAGLQPAVDNFRSLFHAIDWKLESDRDIIPRHLNHTDKFFSVQLVIQAQQPNSTTSFNRRAVVIETLHASGDQTTDFDWYVKCPVLGGIYSAAVV
ncbi:hypothetical protein C5167_020104 [Papaver somniferum]|uniref:COQ9 C-terminal domain-containing protein n=1 Tax=Papaver somniferum TaxID=3469 RepID=A0A4Y7IU60_PAPSO|nr:hypothetical protein C5167_020104 [Papaver somniferum]